MASGFLVPVGALLQILSDQGVVGSGFKINTYVGGSVSTPLTTYTDSTLGTPNSNPIVMGSNGRFQNVNIWVPSGTLTKVVLTDASNNVIAGGTVDNLPAINDLGTIAYFALSAGEIAASITPTNLSYPVGDVRRYGADPTGVSDSTTAINNATTAANQFGGTVFFPGGTYKCGTSLNLLSNVEWRGQYNATINYTGAATAITTNSTGVTLRAAIRGLTVQALSASTCFSCLSCYQCAFEDLSFVTNSLTNTVISMGVNTTGTTNPAGNYNNAENIFKNVNQDTSAGGNGCGNFIVMSGNDASHVVTLNTFINLSANLVNVVGIDAQQWCDTNLWCGNLRINLSSAVSPANGIGMRWGHNGAGVYAWVMEEYACDVFGSPATDNRVALVADQAANIVKFMTINLAEAGPNGTFFGTITGLLSCWINQAPRGVTNYQSIHALGANLGVGAQASTSAGVIVSNAQQISGASQFGYYCQTPGANQGSPSLVAGYGTQPSLSSSVGAYVVANVMGFYCAAAALGTNATATALASFYAQSQTVGGSNYGFYCLQNNATANDRAFMAAGTAPSQFNAGSSPPAGGATNVAILFSSTSGFGIYMGSGAPTVTAAQGSLYLRTDGSSGTSRAYINNSAGSGTTWTAINTVA